MFAAWRAIFRSTSSCLRWWKRWTRVAACVSRGTWRCLRPSDCCTITLAGPSCAALSSRDTNLSVSESIELTTIEGAVRSVSMPCRCWQNVISIVDYLKYSEYWECKISQPFSKWVNVVCYFQVAGLFWVLSVTVYLHLLFVSAIFVCSLYLLQEWWQWCPHSHVPWSPCCNEWLLPWQPATP